MADAAQRTLVEDPGPIARDQSWLLELTNGHVWSFTQGGGEAAFKYPWSLTVYVESWGCADPKPAQTP